MKRKRSSKLPAALSSLKLDLKIVFFGSITATFNIYTYICIKARFRGLYKATTYLRTFKNGLKNTTVKSPIVHSSSVK